MRGATWKRIYYFLSAVIRFVSSILLFASLILVKIFVDPQIWWLNVLLFVLMLTTLASGLFNLVLCGLTASAYQEMFKMQLICFISTLLTGDIVSSTFTGLATFIKVEEEEILAERIYNTKTFRYKNKEEVKKNHDKEESN
ncbi:MAG: hypothetical protein E7356_03895 [Clostridiales bacterium]|nr:hypothetical protein [Clostridiales bacterium]